MSKKEFIETSWFETIFELSNGASFSVVHNCKQEGNINSINAAFDNWLERTKDFSEKSFIGYINAKGVHKAMTKENYLNLRKSFFVG